MMKHFFISSGLILANFTMTSSQQSPVLALVHDPKYFGMYSPPLDYLEKKGYILRWIPFDNLSQFDYSTVSGVIINQDPYIYTKGTQTVIIP